jgi:hypothetical protein
MAKQFFETVVAYGGFAGETFDIAAGGANTAIIDVLLSAGSGVLTQDAPFALLSSGALFAGGVTLDISAMEVEAGGRGTEAINGRPFILSVQNSNISATNKITVNGSVTINGIGTLDITSTGDYLFTHLSGGAWIANILPRPAEALATIKRIPFASTVWDAGANKNTILIKQTGAVAPGETVAHGLTVAGSYIVQVVNTDATPDEIVDCEVQIDPSNGNITLKKTGLGADFTGIATIVGSLD